MQDTVSTTCRHAGAFPVSGSVVGLILDAGYRLQKWFSRLFTSGFYIRQPFNRHKYELKPGSLSITHKAINNF
ncbi:MAG: hypothetical protein EA359_00885 [Balneolaceae bacterium]|nr:MAG: hypothetical protein EA359_00885 [Balneolaceae bacterium]